MDTTSAVLFGILFFYLFADKLYRINTTSWIVVMAVLIAELVYIAFLTTDVGLRIILILSAIVLSVMIPLQMRFR
jgi:hypothetical protein